ncbi:MAG: alkaline phosphatase family protein [Chlamydiota bacterium]
MSSSGTQPPPEPLPPMQPEKIALSVQITGSGRGVVTSTPSGIDCGATCSAGFAPKTQVTLMAASHPGSQFVGWSGACTGTGACSVKLDREQAVTASFDSLGVQALNHIVFMLQENRSFDHMLGHLPEYWLANGYPPQPFDGMPVGASNPSYDGSSTISAFRLLTSCVEGLSPAWNESHVDWNRSNPISATATLDGFVRTAAGHARGNGFFDTEGRRAVGYYDHNILPYYHFLASNFAISDRWFSSVMTRTQPNRMYLIAGTSAGRVYPPVAQLTNKTIFQLLDERGISYKIYVTDYLNGSPVTYFTMFSYANQHMNKVVPLSQYFEDVQNGTLPQVAMIDSGYVSGLDEHPSAGSVQKGAHHVSTLINALMNSPSWKDSVFLLTYDEFGGLYDHVPPQPTVHPDGIAPVDLQPGDICTTVAGPNCDFVYTGYRVPLIVISPFARRNYVSHTVADLTAILKFIETRFGLPSLTARDAAQMDMTEFFDFVDPPWIKPPVPPAQPRNAPCYHDHLP